MDEQILSKIHYKFHTVVHGDLWQAAEPIGDYVLVGCTVAPGWELEDEEYYVRRVQDTASARAV